MTVEILCIHEDYVTETMFTSTEWLASAGWCHQISRPIYMYKKYQRNNRMFVYSFLTRLRGRTMARIAKTIRATIDLFLRTPLHNKPFSKISDQANKLLEHL